MSPEPAGRTGRAPGMLTQSSARGSKFPSPPRSWSGVVAQYEKVEQDKELGKRKCAIAKIKALRNLNLALILICTIQLITIARNTSKKEC